MRKARTIHLISASLLNLLFWITSGFCADLNLNIGQFPRGASVTITFDAVIVDPLPKGVRTVAARAIVTGDNFTPVMSDDPQSATPNDPTLTVVTELPIVKTRDLIMPADNLCSAIVTPASVDNGSFDPDGGPLTLVGLSPASPYPLGDTVVTLVVRDDEKDISSATATVTVEDRSDPMLFCPTLVRVVAGQDGKGMVPDITNRVFAIDVCTPVSNIVITQDPVAGTPVSGVQHTINITAMDESGNTAECETWLVIDQPTRTPTPSLTKTSTPTATPTTTNSSTSTKTLTYTKSQTSTRTPSSSQTGTWTSTPSSTMTPENTETPSLTNTRSQTPSATFTTSPSATSTPSNSPSVTESPNPTSTATETVTATTTASLTPVPSSTPTHTGTETLTATFSATESPAPTSTGTATPTTTITFTPSESPTRSFTRTLTPTQLFTASPTPTSTQLPYYADYDGDGVPNGIEDGGPYSGDGNGDGTDDSQQEHVATLINAVDGQYVTLIAAEGSRLRDVTATLNTAPIDPPKDITFPAGMFSFRLTSFSGVGPHLLTIVLPEGMELDDYWKYGPLPGNDGSSWYLFDYDGTTGASVTRNVAFLWFRDGDRGDDDLLQNEIIIDLGGPVNGITAVKDWNQY